MTMLVRSRRMLCGILVAVLGLGFLVPVASPIPLAMDTETSLSKNPMAPSQNARATTPEAPFESESLRNGFPLDGSNPYEEFLMEFVKNPNPTPQQFVDWVQEYYHSLGFGLPATETGSLSDYGTFDDNETLLYSYDVGDVNGDGYDDIALDTYCLESGCDDFSYSWIPPELENYCGVPHRLTVRSGRDGSEIWARSLNEPFLPFVESCSIEFVVGLVPNPEGHQDFLLYRIGAFARLLIEHDIHLMNGKDASSTWHYIKRGFVVPYFVPFTSVAGVVAENLLVNPIPQIPSDEGVSLVPEGTKPALFAQGIGFLFEYADSMVVPPGYNGPLPLIISYEPREWAALLDLATGVPKWEMWSSVVQV